MRVLVLEKLLLGGKRQSPELIEGADARSISHPGFLPLPPVKGVAGVDFAEERAQPVNLKPVKTRAVEGLHLALEKWDLRMRSLRADRRTPSVMRSGLLDGQARELPKCTGDVHAGHRLAVVKGQVGIIERLGWFVCGLGGFCNHLSGEFLSD